VARNVRDAPPSQTIAVAAVRRHRIYADRGRGRLL